MSAIHLALDIETLAKAIPESKLREAEARIGEANAKKYKKQETIDKNNAADLEAFKDKWKFSREGAQILCIGIGAFDEDGLLLEDYCSAADDEKAVLQTSFEQMSEIINKLPTATFWPLIYTYNGDSFDIPHIIRASIEHGIFPEYPFNPRNITDLMKYPFERFLSARKLDDLCSMYGITTPSQFDVPDYPKADGSMVAEMWAKDKKDGGTRVDKYCMQDVCKVGKLAALLNKIIRR